VADSYRDERTMRVLFCIGVQQSFFEEPAAGIGEIVAAIEAAFADLSGRFGLRVLGTMDDDEVMVGSSPGWPWTCYILADCPDYASVTKVCNVVRDGRVGEAGLWKYLKIEARIGRPLFFGNE
jgi:hypothetical protein